MRRKILLGLAALCLLAGTTDSGCRPINQTNYEAPAPTRPTYYETQPPKSTACPKEKEDGFEMHTVEGPNNFY